MIKYSRLSLVAAGFIILAAMTAFSEGRSHAIQPWLIDELIGNPAPDFTLSGLDGKPVSLSSFKGSPVLLNFWATWCPYCRREREHLKSLYEDYMGKGLVIVSVSIDRSRAPFTRFMKRNPAPYINLHDTGGAVSSVYSVAGLPTTYLVNRDGVIKRKLSGFIPWNEGRARDLIERFIKTD